MEGFQLAMKEELKELLDMKAITEVKEIPNGKNVIDCDSPMKEIERY